MKLIFNKYGFCRKYHLKGLYLTHEHWFILIVLFLWQCQWGWLNPNNFLITGPNAGGKSTLIKSLTLCILLSQTLCISPAENLILTPFKLVNTYLNIPDCKGKESLFEAEMHRARDHINDLKLLNKKITKLNF